MTCLTGREDCEGWLGIGTFLIAAAAARLSLLHFCW